MFRPSMEQGGPSCYLKRHAGSQDITGRCPRTPEDAALAAHPGSRGARAGRGRLELAPWRFLVLRKEGRAALVDALAACFRADHPEATPDQIEKEHSRYANTPLIVGVISRAAPHVKIPEWEQVLSAGAACMNLVNAAHAMGFGANWVTGWAAYDRSCLDLLGVGENERVAGFIHIGTPTAALEDRPRPKLDDIVTKL
jgi:nitroreductase